MVLVVVVVQAEPFLVLMVVVELVVGRLPNPLSDILVEERARGLLVGMLMLVGGATRMELVIVVMLVAVVVVFMAVLVVHITWVEFMLVLELLVTLVEQLVRFTLVAFFILIIALLLAKASLFSSSILAFTSLW